jgi:hypothetical protein
MKCFYAHSVAWALGLASFATSAQAQYSNQPSLLPIPAATQAYPISPVAHREMWDDGKATPMESTLPSPSDSPSILPAPPMPQPDQSVLSDDYHRAVKGGWGDKDVVYEDGAACGLPGCTPCQNFWYGGVNALVMTREHNSSFLITGDNTGLRLLCSCAGDMDWTGGIDVTLGRSFNCGQNAIEFTYWGLYPETRGMDAYQSTLGNPLVSGINFNGAVYNGAPVTDITGAGFRQQAKFYNQINSFEGNLLGQCYGNGFIGGNMQSCNHGNCGMGPGCCGPRWGCGWMMGVRYFEFDDGFSFNADGADEVFNDDVNELCYHIRLKNRMVGFQVGGGWSFNVTNCFQLYSLAKAGIYNNFTRQDQSLHGAGGIGEFGDGALIDINNKSNNLAMLGQLDLGARWMFSKHFSVNAGYRIMGAGGLATVEGNIPTDFADSYYPAKIETDGSLLLHGGYVGGEFRF